MKVIKSKSIFRVSRVLHVFIFKLILVFFLSFLAISSRFFLEFRFHLETIFNGNTFACCCSLG